MEQSSFTEAELAARARVAPELVGRLVELGILRPADGPAPYGLGDGVMFHFRRPAQAVLAALEMVERTPQAGLPPAHVGPGQVLVSDQVVAECADGQVAFEPIGPLPLKGVTNPVPLHQARRSG